LLEEGEGLAVIASFNEGFGDSACGDYVVDGAKAYALRTVVEGSVVIVGGVELVLFCVIAGQGGSGAEVGTVGEAEGRVVEGFSEVVEALLLVAEAVVVVADAIIEVVVVGVIFKGNLLEQVQDEWDVAEGAVAVFGQAANAVEVTEGGEGGGFVFGVELEVVGLDLIEQAVEFFVGDLGFSGEGGVEGGVILAVVGFFAEGWAIIKEGSGFHFAVTFVHLLFGGVFGDGPEMVVN
jgi:hypothetical protein